MDIADTNSVEGGEGSDPSSETIHVNHVTVHKKRNRIRFSCTSCREKKLKCNRQSPCDQCQKRQTIDSCKFIPYVNPRPTPTGNGGKRAASSTGSFFAPPAYSSKGIGAETAVQARLKHLEHVIQVLKLQKREDDKSSATTISQNKKGGVDEDPLPGLCDDKRAGIITDGHRYVEEANWESILDDIAKLTSDLKASVTEEPFDDAGYPSEQPPPDRKSPILLTGGFPWVPVAELVSHLPPRPVVDRLVARFFQIKEPTWLLFHTPTFLKDYDAFWANPPETTYPCLSLVFAICAHAVLACQAANEEVPGNLGPPLQVFETFKVDAAYCLALGDYTQPGRSKVESLILYFTCEFLQGNDSALGTSILVSVMVRLAMHMGMHRDAKHYRDMTPFEGEMRRRVWALVVETDQLVSFQFGLPSNIPPGVADTDLPRNLHDTDFDEDTAELPPSRPETERTVALYTIVKARLMRAFGDITLTLSSRAGFSYSTLARLDRELEEAHKSFPPILRYRPFGQSLADPIDLIMQRYWLELLYQKSRTILHRQFIARGRMDQRFEYSRRTCLDAAAQTLKHQYDIHCEAQPGGRLAKDRGMITSLSIHDFLLADMILCLELSFGNAREKQSKASCNAIKAFDSDTSTDIMSREQIMQILETSRSIWQSMRRVSAEANKGFKVLTRMLSESTGASFDSSPESTNSGQQPGTVTPTYPPPFYFGADTGSSVTAAPFKAASVSFTPHDTPGSAPFPWTPPMGPSNGSMAQTPTSWNSNDATAAQNIMDGMVEASLTGDWSVWDTQIHKATLEGCQIPWQSFFQANDP